MRGQFWPVVYFSNQDITFELGNWDICLLTPERMEGKEEKNSNGKSLIDEKKKTNINAQIKKFRSYEPNANYILNFYRKDFILK